MQLFKDSMDQFTQRLNTAGLASNATLTSIASVSGYTLEAQLRALNVTSSVAQREPASAPAPSSESAAQSPSDTATAPAAGYALGPISRVRVWLITPAEVTRKAIHDVGLRLLKNAAPGHQHLLPCPAGALETSAMVDLQVMTREMARDEEMQASADLRISSNNGLHSAPLPRVGSAWDHCESRIEHVHMQ